MKKLNLIGQIFGQLTVVDSAPSKHGNSHWVCKCTCGNTTVTSQNALKKGTTKSCGCYRKALGVINTETRFVTHGDCKTRLYSIYNGMRKRCYTPSTAAYPNYGGKGIKVSFEWDTYEIFKEWALSNGYTDSLTLDRKDSTKDYSPDNCRWANYETQTRNRRKQVRVTSSMFIGVSWNIANQKWVAYVTVSKKTILLGYFDDELTAAKTRDSYIKERGLLHFKMNF